MMQVQHWSIILKVTTIKPNNGIAQPHGKSDYNEYIDKMIDELKEGKGNENVRKNQKHEEIIKKNDPNSVFHKKLL